MIRQADDGQDAVRDRPLLDAQMIGAACGLHGNLSRFYQDYVFRTVFAVDRNGVCLLRRRKVDLI